MSERRKSTVVQTRAAGPGHEVLSLQGPSKAYKRKPCEQCPWRKDQAGSFPAEAFVHSAETAYEMSEHTFACHMAGAESPATCAGFLMVGADHNLAVRMHYIKGEWDFDAVSDGGLDLWQSYRAMAVANGVDPDHPALVPCRGVEDDGYERADG